MHLSHRELLDDFLAFVNESGDALARDIAERIVNRAITTIWLRHTWQVYRSPVPLSLVLTVNQSRYSLPDYFGRVGPGVIRNMTRGGAPLIPRPAGGIEEAFPWAGSAQEQASQSRFWEIAGIAGVHTQPLVTGEALEVLSDSVSDGDIVAAIAGDDGTGTWTRQQVTLQGASPVQIGTWSFVDEFAKAFRSGVNAPTDLTSSRGTVTLRKSADRAELQRLFPQESAREHSVLYLYPTPIAPDVLAIPVMRRPKRLLHDGDSIPDLWEPAVWEAMLIEWQVNKGDSSVAQAATTPRPALIDLIAHENRSKPGVTIKPYRRP